jgi:pyruvate kinase
MSRRAKIVCTLGHASSGPERLAALVAAGLDVARLNMSHGTQDGHRQAYHAVRQASDASGHSRGVLVDLQGPKIRLGRFPAGPVRLLAGQEFCITTQDVPGDSSRASTTYQGLADDVRPWDRVLVDDGRIVLEVLSVRGARVRTRVLVGGTVSDHKGLNLPGVKVSVPSLTAKDAADLRWALGLRADMIALSFVQGPEDAGPARQIMDEAGVSLPLIAKIEKPQAVQALPEVIEAFDGIMVARGDLGVELPLEQVPMAQKRMISLARDKARPVIVATQMLESMISSPRPTRAEASDVANAVLDGADALMLSAETSVGEYPVETVETMARGATAQPSGSEWLATKLARSPTDFMSSLSMSSTSIWISRPSSSSTSSSRIAVDRRPSSSTSSMPSATSGISRSSRRGSTMPMLSMTRCRSAVSSSVATVSPSWVTAALTQAPSGSR